MTPCFAILLYYTVHPQQYMMPKIPGAKENWGQRGRRGERPEKVIVHTAHEQFQKFTQNYTMLNYNNFYTVSL